jgi:hypothetical protein
MLAWQKRARHTDTIVGAPPKNYKKNPFSGENGLLFIERFRGARHRSPDLAVALVNARGIACGVRTLTSLPYILSIALEQDLVKCFFKFFQLLWS